MYLVIKVFSLYISNANLKKKKKTKLMQPGKMAQCVKHLLCKPDGLALTCPLQIHIKAEGENTPTELFSGLHMLHIHILCTFTVMYIQM